MLHIFLSLLLAFAAAASAAPPGPSRLAFVEEVPFITTPDSVTAAMLDLAAVKAGDHVIDLGSGDGRIVIAAARRGATGMGVEIDPRLVEESIRNARRAGLSKRARFLEQDLFKTDLSPATVVTIYLLPEVNLQLRPAILLLRPGTRIVSHDWDMGDWKPDRSVTLAVPEKSIGLGKASTVHLWIVPARVEGLWCGAQGKRRAALRIRQAFQFLEGEIEIDGKPAVAIAGRVDGATMAIERAGADGAGRLQLVFAESVLRPTLASVTFAAAKGLEWRRAQGAICPGLE
ncbi:MAG: methyltransferase domain-containing protein [Betaproteobacteria bacterium]|nr:methyltransferase domain-containing protein [Betaproteobacteria bacterium]